MIPTIIKLGPIPIHSFGLMMMCAFIAAHELLVKLCKTNGVASEYAEKMIFWAAIGGIVGARLGYVFTYSDGFEGGLIASIFSSSGFVFHWGLIGGFLGVTVVLLLARLSFFLIADLVAAPLALGYAIGRIGCQLSGDGDYGSISNLPFAMSYPLGVIPTRWGELVHPAPIYESLLALLTTFLLLRLLAATRLTGRGIVFGAYLILTGVARYAIEFIRIEPIVYNNLTQAQVVSLYLIVVGALFIWRGFLYGNTGQNGVSGFLFSKEKSPGKKN